jgi:phage-related protein
MEIRLAAMYILTTLTQFLNALLPIVTTLEPRDSDMMAVFSNAVTPILVTLLGIVRLPASLVHPQNAP